MLCDTLSPTTTTQLVSDIIEGDITHMMSLVDYESKFIIWELS